MRRERGRRRDKGLGRWRKGVKDKGLEKGRREGLGTGSKGR